MNWICVTVFTTDAGLGPVCDALSGAGIDSVSIEESADAAMAFLNERTVYWDFVDSDSIGVETPCVKAYLADVPESDAVLDDIKLAVRRLRSLDLPVDLGSLDLVAERTDDSEWKDNWKAYYKPLPIGRRLLVVPSWEQAPDEPDRAVLTLDPGVAFGTGAHHTTRMCLELLENRVQSGMRVLDLGCGSGILSIAAVLLGATDAVAVDIDPVAEHIARENAARNRMPEGRFRIEIGDVTSDEALVSRIEEKYDVVLANIVADVILRIAPLARRCTKENGVFIASGIIDERKDEVLARLTSVGFSVETVLESGGWVAVCCRG